MIELLLKTYIKGFLSAFVDMEECKQNSIFCLYMSTAPNHDYGNLIFLHSPSELLIYG